MPKIRITQSSVGQAVTQLPGVASIPGRSGVRTNEAIQIIDSAVNEVRKLRDFSETSEAMLSAKNKMQELSNSAANDDIDNMDTYANQVDGAIDDALASITNPVARLQTKQELDILGLNTKNRMLDDNYGRRKKLATGFFWERMTQNERAYSTGTPEERQIIEAETQLMIEDALDKGLIQPKTAGQFKAGFRNKFQKAFAENYVQIDPEGATKKENYENLDALSASEIAGYRKRAATLLKQRESSERVMASVQLAGNEADVTMKIAKNEIDMFTPQEIVQMVSAGEISREYAEAAINVLSSEPWADIDTPNTGFTELVDEMFSFKNSTIEASREFMIDVLKEAGKGRLNRAEAQYLLEAAANRQRELRSLDVVGETIMAGVNAAFEAGHSAVKEYADTVPDANRTRIYSDFLREAKDDPNNAEGVAANVILNEKKRITPEFNQYKVDDIIVRPQGSFKVIGHDTDGMPLLEPL